MKPIFKNLYEELFYKSLRIRLVEERIIELYPTDKIQSPVHLSIGQEPVAVGICQSLLISDLLFCSYRCHSYYLAKGGNLNEMFAELYGKITGCAGGKAGSMHLVAANVGLMGSSAIVASTISHAVGAALATKNLKKDQVVVVAFGDGATEEGVYHESINFAMLHRLPVIFICENNGLAVHSKINMRQSYQILEHVKTYGIKTKHCPEGYDFVKVHNAFSEIVEHVRQTKEPYFIEINTFRYKEHVGPGDDYHNGYRNISEFEQWKLKDPLMTDLKLVEKFSPVILEEIDAAINFAEQSQFPTISELYTDVI